MNTQNEIMISRVCSRLHGEVSPEEAAAFDKEMITNPNLARVYRQIAAVDRSMSTLPLLKANSTFTASVLRKTRPVVLPAPEKTGWLDWLTGLAPAAGLLIIALIWGRELWGRATGELTEGAGWLDQTLGTQWFAHQPLILLGGLLPFIVLGVAYLILTNNRHVEA